MSVTEMKRLNSKKYKNQLIIKKKVGKETNENDSQSDFYIRIHKTELSVIFFGTRVKKKTPSK